MMPFQKNHVIFAQGEPSDGLFFIQEGKVQLSVVSEAGKEATLGILGEDDFFGEGAKRREKEFCAADKVVP